VKSPLHVVAFHSPHWEFLFFLAVEVFAVERVDRKRDQTRLLLQKEKNHLGSMGAGLNDGQEIIDPSSVRCRGLVFPSIRVLVVVVVEIHRTYQK
jgi:hypothetical protein